MKIQELNYSERNNKAKLSADVVLKNGKKHTVYFEVERAFKDFISKDADPFLPVALPIAMKKKEFLEIGGMVSKRLLNNTPQIKRILKSWDLGLSPISITADVTKSNAFETKDKIGCFFSAGVDSFYTYLKNKNKINHLIFVHGFDISAKDDILYRKIVKNIIKISHAEKINLIKVKTNVREVFDHYFEWIVSDVFALASVSLFLGHGLKEIFMSCGRTDVADAHGYMTPELDVLWSSENMHINHYGCDADKIAKLKFLQKHKIAMENLRVCWRNKYKRYNCCECEKCFRNMLALYVNGALDKCKTFKKELDLEKLRNIRVNDYELQYFTAILKRLKRDNDNSETRFALEEGIKNIKFPKLKTKLKRNIRDFIRYFDNKYNQNRMYWFLAKRDLI